MNPDGGQDEIWARLRNGVLVAAKAMLAVAALSGVAQVVSRTTLDRAMLGQLVSRAGPEPKTTGTVTSSLKPASSRPSRTGIDQAGMASLASQVTGAADRKR
jgi:hypothetical protein